MNIIDKLLKYLNSQEKKAFSFSINERKFDFSDAVPEEDRVAARENVYQNYNPPKHVLRRDSDTER